MAEKTKKRKKELQKKQLVSYVKELKLTSTRQVINLEKDELWCHLVTRDACWRPDIYLDNGKSCDGCKLYTNCSCSIKRIKKR